MKIASCFLIFSHTVLRLTFALICLLTISACAPVRDGGSLTPSAPADQNGPLQDDSWTDAQVDSENLTDDAESLLSIETLDQALEKFTEALRLNPQNARADVWKAFVTTELEFKGFLARVRPFVESLSDGPHRYDQLVDDSSRASDPVLRHFYLSGPNDIHTADDFQEWVDRVNLQLGQLRSVLNVHRNEEIRLLVPQTIISNNSSVRKGFDGTNHCASSSWGPIKYQPSDCSKTASEFLMNRADIEAVSSGVALYQSMISVMNAYRLTPTLINKLEASKTSRTTTDLALIVQEGAKLRSNNQIGILDQNSRDLALGIRYVMDHQAEACQKGYPSPLNRKGYLFAYGVCSHTWATGNDLNRMSQMIEQIIQHQPLTIFAKTAYGEASIDFDVAKLSQAPMQNLTELGQLTVDACNTEHINTTPFKKYVTRGDLDPILDSMYPKCQKQAHP